VAHVKSRLSAAGEYVPTVKQFERILRNAGCSASVSKRISYLLRNLEDEDDADEMPVESPRNAEDDEMKKAVELAEQILAEAIRRKVA